MKTVFKYLKKFMPLIIAIIALVIVQTMSELALPQYTSNIVNVGIQQGGITEAVPQVIRESELAKVGLFISKQEKEQLESAYILQDGIYHLNPISAEQKTRLEEIFALPLAIIYFLDQDTAITENLKTQIAAIFPEIKDFSGTISSFIGTLNKAQQEQLAPLLKPGMQQAAALDSAVLSQSAIAYLRAEYTACEENAAAIQSKYILLTGFKMLGIALLVALSAMSASFCSARLGAGFSRTLRSAIFNKVMRFSHKELGELSTATLITRSTNDIQQIQMMVTMGLRMLIFAPMMGFGSLIKVINANAGMSWVVGCAVAAVLMLMALLLIITMPKFKILQQLIDKINMVAREALTGLPVVRAFSRENYENERFGAANQELTTVNLFVNRMMSVLSPALSLIMNGVCVLIIWVGAASVNAGTAQVGDLMAFIQYAMHIVMSFMFLSMISIQLPRAIVSIKRVGEILDMPLSVQEPEIPLHFSEQHKGLVEFKQVCFRYPNAEADVLQDISFIAHPGETTAFIGSTGSGKSTLINLLPRFFDVTSGEILIDGMDIRSVSLHELRDKIGFVPQKGQLFSGTVASNIAYGLKDAAPEQIVVAAQVAQAADFIDADPEQYQREISQGGTNVSGGQRQRLSIARAIAKEPDIYIFDDSFSALDYKTDAALRKALMHHTANATVLIVAQRISTILQADQIIVLDKGQMVGIGSHKELLKSCDIYRQIAESQLSKEELEA